ncbi:leucine rich repeat [Seminavis robusta]|uniref:Leucine rich repeat n=1 Tax=Seminavis robusta TaxID=568900 RepID=A0A9N8EPF2_9STRA|nr:leucine rich repeat [Seminavis robusta]|eukprot:Sro1449_g273620.1 leucine rich repeat (634) ;mRNA; f:970-2953
MAPASLHMQDIQAAITVDPMVDPSDSETDEFGTNESHVSLHPQANTNFPTISAAQANHAGAQDSASSSNASNIGLAVAELVQEDDMPRQHAAEVQMDESIQRKQGSMKRFKIWILLGGILFITAVAVLIAVLVSGGTPDESESQSSLETPVNISDSQPSGMEEMEQALLTLFPEETVQAIKGDSESPQSQALQWLIADIDSQKQVPFNDQIKQRFALATLYFATSGASWTNNEFWLDHNIHECDWFIKPDFALKGKVSQFLNGYLKEMFPPTDPPPTTCNAHGLFQNLWLDENNLRGTLPEELFWLSSLETLSLGANSLRGSISSHIGKLTSLQGLAISFLRNAGMIPTELALLTNLGSLGLNDNWHTGSIPTEIWQLTTLQTLGLSLNPDLKGTIPTEIGSLPKLRWMNLDDCDISGSIPTELGKLEYLEWMVLERNRLTGTVPSELGVLPSILLMSFYNNSLQGTLPTELGLLTSLTLLNARNNSLFGSIPSEYGLLSSLALGLELQDNLLSGTIPVQLANLVNMWRLSLQENQLSGHIPSEFGKMLVLGLLNLANNSLSGTVPQELGELKQSLFSLNLEGNSLLSGELPDPLCSLDGYCFGVASLPCYNYGVHFDCGNLICGCGCPCDDN